MSYLWIIAVILIGQTAGAQIPFPTEVSHPGSQNVLLTFNRSEIKLKGRTSALYLPNRTDGLKAPLVVFGHGQAIGEESYDKTLEHLAGKGLAVLFVQYDSGFFDQDWRRMASDWNEITEQTLLEYSDVIDETKVTYSGHSKGGYIGLMAAGAPNQPGVRSVLVFAPAGYDQDYLNALDPKTVVSLFWGERDTIIKKSAVMEIYNKLQVNNKQFVELKSYQDREADHYFPMNKGSIFGGKNGVSAFHYHGVWKWLVAAGWDLENGGNVTQPYVYGDKTATTGDENFTHQVTRSWTVRHEYLVKLQKPARGLVKSLMQNWKPMGHHWFKAVLTDDLSRGLRNREEVQYVGLNHKLETLAEPNDLNPQQWAFKNPLGFDVSAVQAWDLSIGAKDIVVGVVDSGIAWNHSDLKDNIWENEAERDGQSGVDDDNNGYIDDIKGFNFAINQPYSNDSRGHGTMVSGMIGAVGNNSNSITGMAWRVRMMSLNIFPNVWGAATLESTIKALDYAIDNGAQIINASWGRGDDDLVPDEAFNVLIEAIERARDKNILFVAAAGNSYGNNDETGMIPATLKVDNILSVGAMNRRGEKWDETNYGKNNVHVMAPGEDILTTKIDGTATPSGTSLSAPIVTGIAVLMLDVNPNLKPQEIINIMVQSCDPAPALKDLSRCGGYINAAKAVQMAKDLN